MRLASFASLACATMLAACSGSVEVGIGDDDPPPVAGLAMTLTRVGPEAIEVAWSDDRYAASFVVRRDGYRLATVTGLSLIDASVLIDETYCYQVSGYDAYGYLVSASATACVTLLP
jgi:hypothetical protein